MAKVIGFNELLKKRCSCKQCSAIIEYTPGEVKENRGRDYSGGPAGREWIICPNCGKEVTIKSW